MNWIYEPWPWYVAGPLIAGTMILLLLLGKQFGMSSNLRTMCSIGGAGKVSDFFKMDTKEQYWNLALALGAIIGGFIASHFLSNNVVDINDDLLPILSGYGIESGDKTYLPTELFATSAMTLKSVLILIVGGFLVGFGARYAGGCTSGHAISGISNLQWPSVLAAIGFFIGGLLMTHLLFPLIF